MSGQVRDARLLWLVALLAGLLTCAAQAPLSYTIDVGREDGPGSDLPHLSGFHAVERSTTHTFRWTTESARVALPGIGRRALLVELTVLPLGATLAQRAPQQIEIWSADRLISRFPVYPAGAVYRFLLPPPADGDHAFAIHSDTFVPAGDQRALGVPVAGIELTAASGPALPAWRSLAGWVLAGGVLWLVVRRAGFTSQEALLLLLPAVAALGLAALLDPPRAALGAVPALVALGIGWLLVEVVRLLAPRCFVRLGLPLDQRALRWLLLLAFFTFAMRYGGKIYPHAMPGDIGFHANRYAEVVMGQALLLSRNRGVDFPYPPAYYLVLAPLTLLGPGERTLLRLVAALLDALSPLLVYAVASMAPGARRAAASLSAPLVAAAIYSLSASGYMTTWWNFSTHIFTQFAHLLLITTLVWGVYASTPMAGRAPGMLQFTVTLAFLQALVYLGHFGFWINTSLLGGLGLVALLALRQPGRLRAAAPWLASSFVVAQAVALLFFYSAYTSLFAEQARVAASGGLTELSERTAADFDILWVTLWDAGFRVHFGFFAVPLAFAGLALAWQHYRGQRTYQQPVPSSTAVVPALMSGTFVVGAFFAVLPFVTGSNLSTRWLMFCGWAIAVGAGLCVQHLWRAGRAARLAVMAMGAYLAWVTLAQWVGALAWRLRPPEPF